MLNPRRLRSTEFVSGKSSKRRVELLKKLIQEDGLKEPIDVVEIDGEFYILNGHHRVQALMLLGVSETTVRLVSPDALPNYGYENKDAVLKSFAETQRKLEGK